MLREYYTANQNIFLEGEFGDRAYVIEKGEVEICAWRDKDKITMARLGVGDIFGEMALIDDQPRTATALVIKDCEVLIIDREQIRKRLEASEPVVQLLMQTLIRRFRVSRDRLIEIESGISQPPRFNTPQSPIDSRPVFAELTLEREIREAVLNAEFVPFYQPLYDLHSNELAGFEALVRWKHPERGMLTPDRFIELAERSNLIRDIDLFVLEVAGAGIEEARRAQALSGVHRPIFLSANLSGNHFTDDTIIERVKRFLALSGSDPGMLKLEVTEGALMKDHTMAERILHGLKDLGVSIALDDFGTGYSSLSYLHRFPIDVLKIDRSFITDIDQSRRSFDIVRTIIELARSMSMKVVAEGVERAEAVAMLRFLGCDFGQGYYFSRPVPRDQMQVIIAQAAA